MLNTDTNLMGSQGGQFIVAKPPTGMDLGGVIKLEYVDKFHIETLHR